MAPAELDDLVPIAVVIAAGCETCAEKMVRRALSQSTPLPLVEKTLSIVAHLHALGCFAEALGPEAVARMERPLAAARRVLRQAAATPTCCG